MDVTATRSVHIQRHLRVPGAPEPDPPKQVICRPHGCVPMRVSPFGIVPAAHNAKLALLALVGQLLLCAEDDKRTDASIVSARQIATRIVHPFGSIY